MPFTPNGLSPSPPKKGRFPFLLFLCLLTTASAFAQAPADAASAGNAVRMLEEVYRTGIGESAALYTGVQYIRNGEKTEGFPFFQSEEPLPGSVSIGGFNFSGLPLQLDLITGQLVTKNRAGTSLFAIEPGIIDSFIIDSHRFIVLRSSSLLRPGIYEYISAGTETLFIHWSKKLQPRPDYALSVYKNYDDVYLLKAGAIHPISGRKELLAVIGDPGGALKKFIRVENLNFNREPGAASARTFQYYKTLSR